MSKAIREVWHCDLCGWEWLPDFDKVPDRCPNRKCRKRNWNSFAKVIEKMPMRSGLSELSPHFPTCKCLMCKPPKGPK